MSRFSHLEFDGKKPIKTDGQGEPIRDEQFFYQRGVGAWLAGDFEEALTNFSRALEKNSAFYEGWFNQVLMLTELGEFREAKLWADKALELFPEHPELLAAKAVACARDAQVDKAQAYSDNAVQKKNITWYVWLARAEVLLIRKSKMAENCIGSAVGIAGPQAPIARLEAGRLLRKYGYYTAAMEYLETAAKELPKSALAWYELGTCQAKLGFSEAGRVLEQSIKLRPGWKWPADELQRFNDRSFFTRIFSAFRHTTGR